MFFFRRPQFFPKQLFLRFLQQQLFGILPAVLLAIVAGRVYLEKRLDRVGTVAEAVGEFDRLLLFLALTIAVTVGGIVIWTGYRLVLPLGRILVKARSIQKREYLDREEEAAADGGDESEWSDLESTLNRIGRNMQHQDRSLSREREEIEAILSALSDAVAAIDRSGNLLFFNSRFAVLFGDRHLGLVRESRLSDFFRNPDLLTAFRNTLKRGTPHAMNVQILLKSEATPRFFALSVAPLKTGGDETYGAVGVFHDVTDLKHMDQVRIDFVANVSHELRTPLTSIKGYAETLKHDLAENESARRFLETIERNTDRLIALVQDLLSLSSLESGGSVLQKEEVDLGEVTDRVLQQLEKARAGKDISVETKIAAETLWADPKRIEQVLFNLVENAIKYIPAGGHVWIRWARENEEVTLSVRDDGPGIPVEHHTRIFERFYRLDGGRSREMGGTGLGLAIVKHIVQRHGGRVRVRGGAGLGTEFLCSFPSEKA